MEKIKVNGKQQIVEMLWEAEPELRNQILYNLQKTNPRIANEIKSQVISFEDLVRLSHRDLREVLKSISKTKLFIAMRMSSISMRQKVCQVLSERQAEELLHYLTYGAKETVRSSRRAQEEIVQIARNLSSEKVISLRGGAQDVFV